MDACPFYIILVALEQTDASCCDDSLRRRHSRNGSCGLPACAVSANKEDGFVASFIMYKYRLMWVGHVSNGGNVSSRGQAECIISSVHSGQWLVPGCAAMQPPGSAFKRFQQCISAGVQQLCT
jgi:hypothetical protein